MILQALEQLYDRLKTDPAYDISEPGLSLQGISCAVVIRPDGSVVDIQDIREETLSGKKTKRVPRKMQVLGGDKPKGSGMNPSFLWDTFRYLLGYGKDESPKDAARTADCFAASKAQYREYEKAVGDPAFSAVCRFYEKWNPADCANYPLIESVGGYAVFQISGEPGYVHERPAVRACFLKKEKKQSSALCQSLLSGKMVTPARLQEQIKGIGEKAGPLVGFNDPAYESYCKTQSFNAPVGEEESFRYTTALNALTNGPMKNKHRVMIGDMKVVFWSGESGVMESVFPAFLGDFEAAQDEAVRQKLELCFQAFRQGRIPVNFDPGELKNPFYVLGLSPNAARIVVRFFFRSTTGELLENLKKHFLSMRMVKRNESDPDLPSIRQILDQTCPLKNSFPDRDQLPDNLEGLLVTSILGGTPYPATVFNRILLRIQHAAYQDYIKVAFMKSYLTRNHRKEFQMSLDTTNTSPAYLCGRIFAVFEKTQRDALGDTGTTIRGSYSAAASAKPASTFPRLLKLYQHHLAKLEGGQKTNREKLMQEIMEKLPDSFPASLSLTDQGAFFIGFYQQMQNFFTKKDEAPEAASEQAE